MKTTITPSGPAAAFHNRSTLACDVRSRNRLSFRDPVASLLRCALFLILCATPAAQGANTFSPTGSLATASRTTTTLLPNGKVLVSGGAGFDLSGASVGLTRCELFDPATGQWSPTGPLTSEFFGRGGVTATVLPNGKVLIAGGSWGATPDPGASLYDSVTGTWTQTGSLITARSEHTATLLPNGKVLITGGRVNVSGANGYLSSAELYDPATGTWSAASSMSRRRAGHTATLLPNGKVLVAAGFDPTWPGDGFLELAELYDPATNTWTATGSLAIPRGSPTATLLPNGKVLLASGGYANTATNGAELYDPATGTWAATGSLATGRKYATASLLPNGKVLVTGGSSSQAILFTSSELYDPATGTWSPGGSFGQKREKHSATVLTDGRVLIVGGVDWIPQAGGGFLPTFLDSAEIFEPAAGSWTATGSLTTERIGGSSTLLPNGKILIAGGRSATGDLASAELYNPATGISSPTGVLAGKRSEHTATLLTNGKVLVTGGYSDGLELSTAELYDPATGTWTATGALAGTRVLHTATLLPDGRVLVVGGTAGINFLASAEVYNPVTGTWSAVGSLTTGRSDHAATLLSGGRVLVTGGYNGTYLTAAELFDPATGLWSATGTMAAGRSYHTATLLPTGKVLVAGGRGTSFPAAAELYDPTTGLWTNTGVLAAPRRYHSAILLPNGTVLIAGGAAPAVTASVEIYSPATGLWSTVSPLSTVRSNHKATLLPTGKIFITGGRNTVTLATSELYDAGLGYSEAWRPQITSASYDGTGRLVLTGTGFRGISGGSGGISNRDSPTNYPVVQLRRLDNEQIGFAIPDAGSNFSATAFTSSVSSPISGVGHMLVTVIANGIPGPSAIVSNSGVAGIAVEQPAGIGVANGGSRTFTASVTATANTTESLTFTIRNSGGIGVLTGLGITTDGPDVGLFTVTANPAPSVGPGGTTTFTVQFAPTTPGTKTAALHISNNVAGSNPFNINLTGLVTAPAIVVERPGPVSVADGGSVNITTTTNTPQNLNFTIKNPGNANLTGLTITKDGATPGEFTVTTNPTAPVIPAGSTTFTVQVATATAGLKSAALHITNNAPGNNPFDISFTVRVLSYTADGDGDGLNDASELDMAGLGFDWQVSQPALVNMLMGSANKAGLYTTAQIQALNVGTPLLAKDPTTGKFKLTVGVQKATNLTSFLDFPMNGAGKTTTINGQGKLEFDFTVPDNTAFFRVQSR